MYKSLEHYSKFKTASRTCDHMVHRHVAISCLNQRPCTFSDNINSLLITFDENQNFLITLITLLSKNAIAVTSRVLPTTIVIS